MTPNKVQHFQEWLSGFKKKPVIIHLSKLPKESDYNSVSPTYEFTEQSIKVQQMIVDWRFNVKAN